MKARSRSGAPSRAHRCWTSRGHPGRSRRRPSGHRSGRSRSRHTARDGRGRERGGVEPNTWPLGRRKARSDTSCAGAYRRTSFVRLPAQHGIAVGKRKQTGTRTRPPVGEPACVEVEPSPEPAQRRAAVLLELGTSSRSRETSFGALPFGGRRRDGEDPCVAQVAGPVHRAQRRRRPLRVTRSPCGWPRRTRRRVGTISSSMSRRTGHAPQPRPSTSMPNGASSEVGRTLRRFRSAISPVRSTDRAPWRHTASSDRSSC